MVERWGLATAERVATTRAPMWCRMLGYAATWESTLRQTATGETGESTLGQNHASYNWSQG